MGIRIHELEDGVDSSGLTGDELLEISRLSATVTMTETTISAVADSNGGSYLDSGSGFVTAGFDVGDSVRVEGFTSDANNIFTGRITALDAGEMTIGGADGDGIVNEAAGDSVTITKWETRRIDVAEMGASDRSTVTALSISSGVVDIDCALGDYFTLALNANVTSITFSNLPASGASLMIRITQDSTPRTVAWPASFKWAGGSAGAVSTGSGAVDLLAITTLNAGTAWNATLAKALA